jgi:hypothetical protein
MANDPKSAHGAADHGATDFVKSDYDKAIILDSVHADNLMSAVLNLSAELWVVRRRMLISEKLAGQKVYATGAAIDAYVPTPQEKIAWEHERDVFIDRTLSVLTRGGNKKIEGASIPMSRNSAPLRNV